MALLHNFTNKNVTDTTSTTDTTDERTSRAKKSKLMKVCVDCARSALKENMEKKIAEKKNHVTLTNNDASSSDSSTCNNENSFFTNDELSIKMPAVVRKKSFLTTNFKIYIYIY